MAHADRAALGKEGVAHNPIEPPRGLVTLTSCGANGFERRQEAKDAQIARDAELIEELHRRIEAFEPPPPVPKPASWWDRLRGRT